MPGTEPACEVTVSPRMIQVEPGITWGGMPNPAVIARIHMRRIRMTWLIAKILVRCRRAPTIIHVRGRRASAIVHACSGGATTALRTVLRYVPAAHFGMPASSLPAALVFLGAR
jgi:hypothetical protein